MPFVLWTISKCFLEPTCIAFDMLLALRKQMQLFDVWQTVVSMLSLPHTYVGASVQPLSSNLIFV